MKIVTLALKTSCLATSLCCLLVSCTYINSPAVETSSIIKTAPRFKQIYKNREYSDQKLNFIANTNLLAISDVEKVIIINLKDQSLVKKISSADSMIKSGISTQNGKKFAISTDMSTQIWDTTNWKLLKQFKSKQVSKLSGVSSNGHILYFDGTLWSLDTYEKIKYFGDETDPGSYDFSNDNQYFITSEHHFGAVIIPINSKNNDILTNRINNLEKVKFRSDNNYYASYDAKFIVKQGGYRAKTIGLFNIKNNDLINSYSPNSRITCWTVNDDSEILMGLFNGDIVLLNDKLEITHKWHIDNDHIYTCEKGNNNEVWLGGRKTGIYKADLTSKTLSKTYETSNMITNLKVSPDNKYLGMTEFLIGESIVKVFELK